MSKFSFLFFQHGTELLATSVIVMCCLESALPELVAFFFYGNKVLTQSEQRQ